MVKRFLVLCSLLFPLTVAQGETTLLEHRVGGLSLQLNALPATTGESPYRLTIRRSANDKPQATIAPTVFSLENPPRLVVDVSGHQSRSPFEQALNDQHLSKIRIGVHPEKVRLVLDLKRPAQVDYTVIPDKFTGAVSVDFVFGGRRETPTPTASTEEPIEPETETPSPTETILIPEDSEEETENVAPTVETELEGKTKSVDITETPDQGVSGGLAQITGINFSSFTADGRPAVVVAVGGLGNYSLVKRSDKIFELVLENAKLKDDHLALPYFAPDGFSGMEAVIAKQESKNVVVKIYVEKGTKLTPFRTKGQLWLKVLE